MPRPSPPPDLAYCVACRKLIGPHGGWFGAECQCGVKLTATGVAHSIQSLPCG